MMEIKISFESYKDLKQKLGTLLEDMECDNTQLPLVANNIVADEIHQTPVSAIVTEMLQDLIPDVTPAMTAGIEKPKRVKVKNKFVTVDTTAPFVEPTQKTEDVISVDAALTMSAPKNFYSESEFVKNFPKIMSTLLQNQTVDQEYVTTKCTGFGVAFIYQISSDKNKLIQLYNELVHEGHVTRKADY